jgi:hypothetical protein
MRHGIEGPLKTADNRMIRAEERQSVDSETLIAAELARSEEMVRNARLVAALRGESYFGFLLEEDNVNKQMKLARKILQDTPFIKKFLPPHIEEEDRLAAIIVGVAITLQASTEKMN